MKKALLMLAFMISILSHAQEIKQIPMINVSGEGKVNAVPDRASISISIESKGTKASEVKKDNDIKTAAVLKTITRLNVAKEDFQTQRVALNPNYDYEKKKYNYIATQTIIILLKDLSKYDELMEGLIDAGTNRIDNVEFKSSKLKQLQSEARKLAVQDAKAKALDFVSVLGQKVGKAMQISDNSQNYNPPHPMYAMDKMAMSNQAESRQTLAVGEMEIMVNVSVGFLLE